MMGNLFSWFRKSLVLLRVCFKEFLYARRSRKDEINRSHYGKEKVFCVSLKLIFSSFLGVFPRFSSWPFDVNSRQTEGEKKT